MDQQTLQTNVSLTGASQDIFPVGAQCPGCRGCKITRITGLSRIPVHSVLLLPTAQEACGFQRGNLVLGFCHDCGLVSNYQYDASLQHYGSRCEESQGYSGTFAAFQRELALRLVERYSLHRKRILEIGCGKGDFLSLLCELGDNDGIGFDPAFVPDRLRVPQNGRVRFVQDFYGEKYADIAADFVCCQMTLEHIHPVADFVTTLRKAIGPNRETVVFIQVPDATRILRTCAFEDIYYEHCSYFTPASLQNVFAVCGFEMVDATVEFEGQYITLAAKPAANEGRRNWCSPDDTGALALGFEDRLRDRTQRWRSFLESSNVRGKRVVLWGSGSKAVSFLTGLNIGREVLAVVDVNPHRHGSYVAGTGHAIIAPAKLREIRPDLVLVMNAVYCKEIREALADMGLTPKLLHI